MSEIDIDSVLLRLRELEAKANEVDSLRKELKELKGLTSVGDEVKEEIENELVKEVELLKNNDIHIPFLQAKVDEIKFRDNQLRTSGNRFKLRIPDVLDAQKITNSANAAAKKLGVCVETYKRFCRKNNIPIKLRIPTEKRPPRVPNDPYKGKYPITKLLNCEYPDFPIHRLKDKLIRSGTKKPECEQCGYKDRRILDGKLPLLINFEDGNKRNHKLENMTLLCYNCTFVCGRGYIRGNAANYTFDPDVLQGATYSVKTRF